MASEYDGIQHDDDSGNAERRHESSFESLRQRYPQLDRLSGMDDEQKIEAFRSVLGTLRKDLDSR
ncbi:hypothetical protein [Bifidobacterium sp. ESL0745]|uniref:hypothetical protein n=1 Tax=Bifidobacterium sp. ESL0745 TaxID=2983226 RepID=UPI0023F96392|nr:hypothetical protein [Bifidobacterium sp. ESL0745]MDF7664968.1 hypothetical protein [Bifidobacterium sp. ESL0745]